ncbi:ubiquinol-cytochrome C chaperone family protein [Indioceanicola profundi]|uniref:ubiquinol-cytochrome C chaperone family protein n=1 Tax=Indioceanicola profundi TaxID=2220096 RepID=UPI000E6AD5D8|nr:ubiquinol-cytochrome C chaperone family protein [Indioceanicola profundi]
MLNRLFRRSSNQRTVAELYGRIVAQARSESFFTGVGVPDTIEGRFELIALHAWLVMRRLSREGRGAAEFNQALFDFMFADLDLNLREAGVSDLKVGDKVKELATHFYGRVKAYEDGVSPGAAQGALEAALDRNLFGSTLPEPRHVAAMVEYVRREAAALDAEPADGLLKGRVTFGPAPQAWEE